MKIIENNQITKNNKSEIENIHANICKDKKILNEYNNNCYANLDKEEYNEVKNNLTIKNKSIKNKEDRINKSKNFVDNIFLIILINPIYKKSYFY